MSNKKQLSYISIAILASSVALVSTNSLASNYKGESYKGVVAAPCPTPLTLKDGFYVGAALGYDSYKTRVNTTALDAELDTFTVNPTFASTGWVGGLFAGYGKYFNTFYLGGELFANGSNASSSYTMTSFTDPVDLDTYNAKVSVSATYGFSLLPGIKLNDSSLLYVRLGYNRTKFKGEETFTGEGLSFSNSNSGWRNGFNYGLGAETAIAENISLRGEYTHTNYGSFNTSLGAGSSTSYSSADNQFMLGLSYHFA